MHRAYVELEKYPAVLKEVERRMKEKREAAKPAPKPVEMTREKVQSRLRPPYNG